jgi:hypothetical protein
MYETEGFTVAEITKEQTALVSIPIPQQNANNTKSIVSQVFFIISKKVIL